MDDKKRYHPSRNCSLTIFSGGTINLTFNGNPNNITSGQIAYYPLDSDFNDASVNSNDGTIGGSSPFNFSRGFSLAKLLELTFKILPTFLIGMPPDKVMVCPFFSDNGFAGVSNPYFSKFSII